MEGKHFPSLRGFRGRGGEVRLFIPGLRAACSKVRTHSCQWWEWGWWVEREGMWLGAGSSRWGQTPRAVQATKGMGIHPGDNGKYRRFSPKVAWWDFHEFPALWITALRKEAKRAPARSTPAVLATLEVYFLKSLPGKSSIQLSQAASGRRAEGNEMHHRGPGRVLQDRCN